MPDIDKLTPEELDEATPVLMECGPDGLSERSQEMLMEHLIAPAISQCGPFGAIQAAEFFVKAATLTLTEYMMSLLPEHLRADALESLSPKAILTGIAATAPDPDKWREMDVQVAEIASLESILAATEAAELAAKSEGLAEQDERQAEADRLAGEREAARWNERFRASQDEYEATRLDPEADESTVDDPGREGDADPVTPDEADSRDEHDPTL